MTPAIAQLAETLEALGYIAEPEVATAVYLAHALGKPLLIEGDAGVGKTELAKVTSRWLDTELIRLQCYEGLDAPTALYEWDYARQLLEIRLAETTAPEEASRRALRGRIFQREFLLERPLLRAITREQGAAVLLIDEIDRADDAFEAFLLELLSDFQVSIPELGTLRAVHRPHVILTSNHTRELGDALRRRCLYLYMEHPSFDKEVKILRTHLERAPRGLLEATARFVAAVRQLDLVKPPGISESLDFARALLELGQTELQVTGVRAVLGCLLKDRHDLNLVGIETLTRLLGAKRPEQTSELPHA